MVARSSRVRIPVPPHVLVYFLRLSNGDIYTGYTDDLKRRFPSIKAVRSGPVANLSPSAVLRTVFQGGNCVKASLLIFPKT